VTNYTTLTSYTMRFHDDLQSDWYEMES
jgi:hypothetical protein